MAATPLAAAIWEVMGSEFWTLAEVATLALESTPSARALTAALEPLLGENEKLLRVGKLLTRVAGHSLGGFRFVNVGKNERSGKVWRLERV